MGASVKVLYNSNCHEVLGRVIDGANKLTVAARVPGKTTVISQIMYYRKP